MIFPDLVDTYTSLLRGKILTAAMSLNPSNRRVENLG